MSSSFKAGSFPSCISHGSKEHEEESPPRKLKKPCQCCLDGQESQKRALESSHLVLCRDNPKVPAHHHCIFQPPVTNLKHLYFAPGRKTTTLKMSSVPSLQSQGTCPCNFWTILWLVTVWRNFSLLSMALLGGLSW